MGGFSAEQIQALKELVGPIAIQIAALRNLLISKGLVTGEEVAKAVNELDLGVTLRGLLRDVEKQDRE